MKEIKKYLESRIGDYSFFFEDLKVDMCMAIMKMFKWLQLDA